MIPEMICGFASVGNILPVCAPPGNAVVGYIKGEYVTEAAT
jgi:hypothetical protein